MAKTKTATAADPNEFYDSLDQTSQDTWDAIASHGWRPGHSEESGEFFAVKGEDTLGPFNRLSDMLATVQNRETGSENEIASESEESEPADADDSLEVELDEDHKGNTYLPGAKPVVDRQLADAAGKYFADNTEWKDAGKKRTDSKSALDAIVATKRHLFYEDPDNTKSMIYKAGGLIIRIAKEQKTVVSVETEKETKATK